MKYGVPSTILYKMMMAESGGNPNAVSPAGAIGLMQFMPDTAASLGIDPHDPYQSIEGAAKYLRQLYDRFGNFELAVAAYNAGPGNVEKYGGIPPFEETQNYVRKIFG